MARTSASVRSEAIALVFAGDDRSARNVPARDLTEADLARLAYRRAAAETLAGGSRPDPRRPDAALVEAIRTELLGTGLYQEPTETATPARARRSKKAAPTTAPASEAPAVTPAEG